VLPHLGRLDRGRALYGGRYGRTGLRVRDCGHSGHQSQQKTQKSEFNDFFHACFDILFDIRPFAKHTKYFTKCPTMGFTYSRSVQ
jgi:hypothetical protein